MESEGDDHSDASFHGDKEDASNNWDPSYDEMKKPSRKVNKRTRGTLKAAREPMLELSDGDESDHKADVDELEEAPRKKALKKTQKKEPTRVKKAGDKEILNPNLVKVNNKLVGNLEQGGLYDSDECAPRKEQEIPDPVD